LKNIQQSYSGRKKNCILDFKVFSYKFNVEGKGQFLKIALIFFNQKLPNKKGNRFQTVAFFYETYHAPVPKIPKGCHFGNKRNYTEKSRRDVTLVTNATVPKNPEGMSLG
jgi:hypothetical protein